MSTDKVSMQFHLFLPPLSKMFRKFIPGRIVNTDLGSLFGAVFHTAITNPCVKSLRDLYVNKHIDVDLKADTINHILCTVCFKRNTAFRYEFFVRFHEAVVTDEFIEKRVMKPLTDLIVFMHTNYDGGIDFTRVPQSVMNNLFFITIFMITTNEFTNSFRDFILILIHEIAVEKYFNGIIGYMNRCLPYRVLGVHIDKQWSEIIDTDISNPCNESLIESFIRIIMNNDEIGYWPMKSMEEVFAFLFIIDDTATIGEWFAKSEPPLFKHTLFKSLRMMIHHRSFGPSCTCAQ